MLDNETMALEAVQYLYDLGHRRIAYVGRASLEEYPEERFSGFIKAVKHFELSLPDEYLTPLPTYNEQLAFDRTLQLLNLPKPPTAIFSFNGTCTLSSYRAIREKGLKIPDDISLLGVDNYSWTTMVDPPIDVFEQPVETMALTAVEAVLSKINGHTNLIQERFPAKLIRRGSCIRVEG
jgi:LacI family transcriptional regulator